jgi:hypothetical protein
VPVGMKKGSHSWSGRELEMKSVINFTSNIQLQRPSPAKVSSIKINEETKRAVS